MGNMITEAQTLRCTIIYVHKAYVSLSVSITPHIINFQIMANMLLDKCIV